MAGILKRFVIIWTVSDPPVRFITVLARVIHVFCFVFFSKFWIVYSPVCGVLSFHTLLWFHLKGLGAAFLSSFMKFQRTFNQYLCPTGPQIKKIQKERESFSFYHTDGKRMKLLSKKMTEINTRVVAFILLSRPDSHSPFPFSSTIIPLRRPQDKSFIQVWPRQRRQCWLQYNTQNIIYDMWCSWVGYE